MTLAEGHVIIPLTNNYASEGTLIQRGGGNGPLKPRQPGSLTTADGANSGRRNLEDERAVLSDALSCRSEGATFLRKILNYRRAYEQYIEQYSQFIIYI